MWCEHERFEVEENEARVKGVILQKSMSCVFLFLKMMEWKGKLRLDEVTRSVGWLELAGEIEALILVAEARFIFPWEIGVICLTDNGLDTSKGLRDFGRQ